MNNSAKRWSVGGFAAVSVAGTLLHFLYGLTGGAVWAAPFSSVNESTWEHMKLLFWPMLAVAAVQSLFFGDKKDFWCIKLRSILTGVSLIPLIFYTYNGAMGPSPDWVNIGIFFISAAIAFILEAKRFSDGNTSCKSPRRSLLIIVAIAVLFVLFTFITPQIGIFKDPITGGYGI